ncbi:MAG: hypothetical protein ACLFRX_11995 [Gemmatimonadota bacterium]
MSRSPMLVPIAALVLSACGGGPPPAPPVPDTVIQYDTITITREVEPPLPEGRPTMICLATGQSVEVRVSAAGDTLVGPRRVPLVELGPAVGFVGAYAATERWFVDDEPITFAGRTFSRFGQPEAPDCRSIKIVGDYDGVNLFADVEASEPFEALYVPVQPGVFQPYQAQVGRVRG